MHGQPKECIEGLRSNHNVANAMFVPDLVLKVNVVQLMACRQPFAFWQYDGRDPCFLINKL